MLIPHVGWVYVLPAATGTINFTIGGKELQFTGPAYHDKVRSLAPDIQLL